MIFGDSTSKGITSLFPSPLLALLLGADYLKRKKKKKKKENKGITSGLEPVEMISGQPINLKDGGFSDLSEEEILKQMLKDRSILELENRLGIKIPTSKDQSEEDLINRVLQMTGRPISKRGDEFTYGQDDGLSFYVNPKINGAGIRYNKKFADGGIAAFADDGPLDVTDLSGEESQMLENILTKLYLSDYDSYRGRRSPDYSKITDEEFDFLQRYERGKVARDMPLLSRYQERVGFYPGGKAFEESDGLPMKEFGASTGIAMLATIPKQLRKAFYGKEYMSNPIEDRIKAEARDIADQEFDELMGRKDGGIVKLQEGGDANLEKKKTFVDGYKELQENPKYKATKLAMKFMPGFGGPVSTVMDPVGAYQDFKNYIFDPTDPSDWKTLPLYLAGPLGGIANKALKARRITKNIPKTSKLEDALVSPAVSVGIPSATLTYEMDPVGSIKNIMSDPEVDTEYYNNPNIAYYDDDENMYFYYNPKDTENPYRYFEGDIPSGYTLEDVE